MKAVLLVLLSLPLVAQDPGAQAVRTFYAEYQKLRLTGLPDRAAAQKLESHWSSELQAAIAAAQVEQARCIKANPGDKGPWVEGDMFSSNFEGFTSVKVAEPKPGTGSRQRLTVNFEHVENGKRFPWTDQVDVIKQGPRWVIDDVVYRRQQGFTSGFGASLKQSLKGGLSRREFGGRGL